MDPQRRALLAGTLALAGANRATAEIWGEPPTPAKDDVSAPIWPPEERIALWSGSPPGAPAMEPTPSLTMNGPRGARELWVSGIARPEINVFRAPHPDGSALLVFPGGSYTFLAVQNEGIDVARRYTPFGTSVFVLTYRLPGEGWRNRDRVPLQDAQRALRLLRSLSSRYSLDAGRIGILGFSAGGHLASDLATAFDERCYAAVDDADQLSARPHFAGLIYPVATLQPPSGHVASRDHLLGENAPAALVAQRSPADYVRADTPPCFIVHAMDDPLVPVEASLQMMAGCRRAKIQTEAHLFETGGHGFGLHSKPELPVAHWPTLFEAWIRGHRA
jgi:acetyl esterase/lipase